MHACIHNRAVSPADGEKAYQSLQVLSVSTKPIKIMFKHHHTHVPCMIPLPKIMLAYASVREDNSLLANSRVLPFSSRVLSVSMGGTYAAPPARAAFFASDASFLVCMYVRLYSGFTKEEGGVIVCVCVCVC